MEVKELNTDRIEEIKEAMTAIFSVEPWNDVWNPEQLHVYVLEIIGNRNSLSFGLYEGGRLIGISLGRIKHWCEGTEYWIDEFGILPKWQGQGAGSRFLAEIEARLAESGITGVVLLTERTVPAFFFYEKSGFKAVDEQVFFAKKIGK